MKSALLLLGLTLTTQVTFAAMEISIQTPSVGARPLESQERQLLLSELYQIHKSGDYSCYRNLDSYAANEVNYIKRALEISHFIDKSKNEYVYADLNSTLPSTYDGLPVDTQIRKLDALSFSVEYPMARATTEHDKDNIAYTVVEEGKVQHIFQLINNKLTYRYSSYDVLKGERLDLTLVPRVRCAAKVKVVENGLFGGLFKTESKKQLPLKDIEFKSSSCWGSVASCGKAPRAP